MRRWCTGAIALMTALGFVALPVTAAEAKQNSNHVVQIGYAGLYASQESGDPIQVGKGYSVLFSPGWSDEDATLAQTIPTLTIDIVLDGQALATESSVTDLGIQCVTVEGTGVVCRDSDAYFVTATVHPLKRGLHTLTYRWSFSVGGSSPFGDVWSAGVFIVVTGTINAA